MTAHLPYILPAGLKTSLFELGRDGLGLFSRFKVKDLLRCYRKNPDQVLEAAQQPHAQVQTDE